MSNVEFGSPSSKVSVETSYRGVGKSHMVLQSSRVNTKNSRGKEKNTLQFENNSRLNRENFNDLFYMVGSY